MYACYSGLTDKMQHVLSGLTAIHDFEHVFFGASNVFGANNIDAHQQVDEIAAARKQTVSGDGTSRYPYTRGNWQTIFVR